MKKTLFIIEHLEEKPGKWIILEYENAVNIVGKENILITNVKNIKEQTILSTIANIRKESVRDLIDKELKEVHIIVLDPQASYALKPIDFKGKMDVIVVGGILGDHPPKGRTYKLLTKYLKNKKNVIVRNIGKEQLTIDGSIYVAYMVSLGKSFDELDYVYGLKIKQKIGPIEHEIYLPYKYPLVNGKPLINKKLLSYLKKGIVFDELRG